MTKRLLALILSLVMVFSLLVSCGGEDTPDTPADDGNQNDGQTSTDTSNGDEQEEKPPRYIPITLKNEMDTAEVTQRLFYPDTVSMLTGLETIKANIDTVFADGAVLRGYMAKLYADAQGLGIYADYIGNTSIVNGDVIYGATPDDSPIGGGKGYPRAYKRYSYRVTSDDTLKMALQYAEKGDIIVIEDDICIDMSDWILGGEVDGFTIETGKIKYEMVIPEGVTLAGLRGDGKMGGTIIKVSSYTNIAIRLEKDARLTGLVIQGPDTPFNKDIDTKNHSLGIRIAGDGARIDNCEISGFANQAIVMEGVKDAKLDHNYIHNLEAKESVAVYISNATATLSHNLFSKVTQIASIIGNESKLSFENNVCVSESEKALFKLGFSSEYHPTYEKVRLSFENLSVKNNTFLCPSALFDTSALPLSTVVENNLFAYGETLYTDDFDSIRSLDAAIYDTACVSIKNNVYDILAPKVKNKTSKGFTEVCALLPFAPVVKSAPQANAVAAKLTVLSSNYYPTATDAPYLAVVDLLALEDTAISAGVKKQINTILTEIGGYSNYLTYFDKQEISQVVNEKTYGATNDEKGQIGGGVGYYRIYTEKDATHVVSNIYQLLNAVENCKTGDIIYIPEGVKIDLSNVEANQMKRIDITKKITLCSNRGYVHEDGSVSTGGVLMSTALTSSPMIKVMTEGVRITGLALYGPDPATHVSHHRHAFSQGNFPPCQHHQAGDLDHAYYYNLQTTYGITVQANNTEIDNCELSGFSNSAIYLTSDVDGNATTGHLIHHNYIHHNQLNGLGYGVCFAAAYAVVDHNLFNYNRHSIAGTGAEHSGYTAHNNIEMGQSLSTYFDMHGGNDRKDGTDIAGEYVYIYNNTYLGDQDPYNLRGRATKDRTFDYNIVYMPRAHFGTKLTHNHYGVDEYLSNVKIGLNIWGIDTGKGKVEDW